MKPHHVGTVWVIFYITLVAMPLAFILFAARTVSIAPWSDRFWWDCSMGFGFVGVSMLAGQFLLGARFRRAFLPFGIDLVYGFHRALALWGLALIATHWLILRFGFFDVLPPAHPLEASVGMTAGRVALGLVVVLCVTSLARARWRIEYDYWRIGHAVLAVAALVLAAIHVGTIGEDVQGLTRQLAWWGLTLSWLGIAGFVRIVRPYRLLRTPYQVVSVKRNTHSTWIVTLRPDGHDGLRFLGGQFVWLTLGRSPFGMKEHPFSITSSARRADGQFEFAIKERGDFTRTISKLAPGTVAYMDGPYGAFVADRHQSASGFVFVAGGIGIAPIMGILRTLADAGDARPLLLLYGSGERGGIIYREVLEQLRKRLNLQVVHVLTEPESDWLGERGFITTELLERYLPEDTVQRRDQHFFICGPMPMTRSVEKSLHTLHVPVTRIHTELFEWV